MARSIIVSPFTVLLGVAILFASAASTEKGDWAIHERSFTLHGIEVVWWRSGNWLSIAFNGQFKLAEHLHFPDCFPPSRSYNESLATATRIPRTPVLELFDAVVEYDTDCYDDVVPCDPDDANAAAIDHFGLALHSGPHRAMCHEHRCTRKGIVQVGLLSSGTCFFRPLEVLALNRQSTVHFSKGVIVTANLNM